jgi:tRNA G18 (ribose-2'-O)-methylase SpoU
MLTFPFTKRKFQSLDRHGRFKWTVKWLGQIHGKLLQESISEKSLTVFMDEYRALLIWQDLPIPDFPATFDKTEWIEFLSDSVNSHRNEYGVVPKEHEFLPRVIEGDSKEDGPWSYSVPYSIALDGLRSVFNVGSILRVCDCAGFKSVILGKTLGDEHRGVRKISMGASSWIPQEKTDDLAEFLKEKKKQGIHVTGVETVESSLNYAKYSFNPSGIVVFGNEEYGLSKEVLKVCDDFIHIPMSGRKNSLNVSNAVSVIAFHIRSVIPS